MIVDGLEFCAEDTTDDRLRRGLAAAHKVLDEAGVTPLEARTADGQMNWASECELIGQPARDKAAAEWRAALDAERQRQAAAAEAAAKAQPMPAPAPTAVQVEQHLDAAHQHENEASQLTAAAQASAADLSRVRGDYGSVQSLRTTIEFEIVDAGSIPVDAIRPYLPRAAIETAIRGFVRTIDASAIKRLGETGVLAGVRIFEKHTAAVR